MPASTGKRGRTSRMPTATAILIWSLISAAAIFTSCVTTTCQTCKAAPTMGRIVTTGGTTATLFRPIQGGQDWSVGDGVRFWFHGTGGGDAIRFQLHDNRAPDPGPNSWRLVWSDEFNGPAGRRAQLAQLDVMRSATARRTEFPAGATASSSTTPTTRRTPRPTVSGQLAITARQSDGSLSCYYGPCQFTSARLISQHKAEFAYGRIETRIKVPAGAGTLAGVLESGHQHRRRRLAADGRDRHHGIRGPRTERDLRHHSRPRIFGRCFLRRHARLRSPGFRQLPYLRHRMAARPHRLVRRRHSLSHRHAGERRAEPVGVQSSVLSDPESRGRRQLRRPGRSQRRFPAVHAGRLRARLSGTGYGGAIRDHLRR